MGLTRLEALEVLELEEGVSDKEIRDRFKQLALKWHPDKNPDNPEEAEEKFQKLSAAYSKLTKTEDDSDPDEDAMTLAELLIEIFGRRKYRYDPTPHLFCDCSNCRTEEAVNDRWGQERTSERSEERRGPLFTNYDETVEKLYGDHLVNKFADKLYNNFNQPKRSSNKVKGGSTSKDKMSSEEASRNAEQLLEAEDKAKREREKKRERNKRKKEAKKKRKAAQSVPSGASAVEEDSGPEENEDPDEDHFDVTSAFIARANKKKSSSTTAPKPHPPSSNSAPIPNNEPISSTSLHSNHTPHTLPPRPPPPAVIPQHQTSEQEMDLAQSRKLASLGNRAAKDGHFGEAVRRYTEAISLYQFDHRYFGNRSFCYDYLHDYVNALSDANKAIELDVSWPKGYYRQGRAYAGLLRLEQAEKSYILALRYDPQYKDAEDELVKIRVEQLMGMGFPVDLCDPAVREFGTVQAAIDAILAGKVAAVEATVTNGYPDLPLPDPPQQKQETSTKERYKLPPRMLNKTNPTPKPSLPTIERPSANAEKRSLWVGNLTSDDITEEMLSELFSKHGDITSVKLLPARRCAFVNYKDPGSASRALKKLQGYHLGECYLLLRYPETSNKSIYMVNIKKPGPVNGNECYYWRTTGCTFGVKCRWEHIPASKGIDLSSMM